MKLNSFIIYKDSRFSINFRLMSSTVRTKIYYNCKEIYLSMTYDYDARLSNFIICVLHNVNKSL